MLAWPTLRVGDTGPAVEAAKRSVYQYLGATGAWNDLMRNTPAVKRFFGPFFVTWVKRAQKKAGIAQSGVLGPRTWEAMNKAGAVDAYSKHLLNVQEAQRPLLVHPVGVPAPFTVCQGFHATAGLLGNWALDYCCPPGSKILACEDGRIRKLSGHDPNDDTWDSQGVYGWSVHFESAHGYRYYVTHLGWRRETLRVGEPVLAGDVLGRVGDQDFRPDHVHYGVTSPLGTSDARVRMALVNEAPRV